MYWRVFDPGHPDNVVINKCNDTVKDDCPTDENIEIDKVSFEFSHVMGEIVWAAYQVIVVILLLNILIAKMNTTLMNLWDHADREWKYSKSFYQVEFLSNEAIFPVPFRF